jgi:hypothetical protein
VSSRVTILGAGPIGGNLASTLSLHHAVAEIVLTDDESPGVAAGKALDVRQSGAIGGSDVRVTVAPLEDAVAGAGVLVVADRAADGREWDGEAALAMLASVSHHPVPLIFAGASQSWLQERAVLELGIPWTRAIGTSAAALEAAVRAATALEAGCEASDVRLAVAGRPPRDVHVLWEWASIGGRPAVDRLPAAALRRIERRLEAFWPPGPCAAASAAARVIGSLLNGRETFTSAVCVFPAAGRAVMLPVRLDRNGISRAEVPELPRVRPPLGW